MIALIKPVVSAIQGNTQISLETSVLTSDTSVLALSSYPLLFTSSFFFAWKIEHRGYGRRRDPTTLKNLPAKKSNV